MIRRIPQPHDPAQTNAVGIPVVLRIHHAKRRQKKWLARKRLPINLHGVILAGSLPMLTLAIWVGWQMSGPAVDLSANGTTPIPTTTPIAKSDAVDRSKPSLDTNIASTANLVVAESRPPITISTSSKPVERRGPKVLQAAGFEEGDTGFITSNAKVSRAPQSVRQPAGRNPRPEKEGVDEYSSLAGVRTKSPTPHRNHGNVRIEQVTPVYAPETDDGAYGEPSDFPIPPPPTWNAHSRPPVPMSRGHRADAFPDEDEAPVAEEWEEIPEATPE